MNYQKLVQELVDGIALRDAAALISAVGLLGSTMLGGYAVTRLIRWGSRLGWQWLVWLVFPRPLSDLAKQLIKAMERGDREVGPMGQLIVGNRLWFEKEYPSEKLVYISAVELFADGSVQAVTDICSLLSRREKRKVLRLANKLIAKERTMLQAKKKAIDVATVLEVVEAVLHHKTLVSSAWGIPTPRRCDPNSGEVCNTCAGPSINSSAAAEPDSMVANGRWTGPHLTKGCPCPDCRGTKRRGKKEDDV